MPWNEHSNPNEEKRVAYEQDPNELGALWLKDGRNGEYMTGTINGVKVVCFLNKKWVEGGNLPKWRVMKSVPKGESAPQPISAADVPF